MSIIKNWSLVTERDFLFKKYGFFMSEEKWRWYEGEGKKISIEQHLAFEVGLASGKQFWPKPEFKKAFVILGYAEKYGSSRSERPVLRPDGKVGDIIITTNLAWAKQEDGVIQICTKSGSLYELETMVRKEEYVSPEYTGKTTEELDEIMKKYFKVKEEEVIP